MNGIISCNPYDYPVSLVVPVQWEALCNNHNQGSPRTTSAAVGHELDSAAHEVRKVRRLPRTPSRTFDAVNGYPIGLSD